MKKIISLMVIAFFLVFPTVLFAGKEKEAQKEMPVKAGKPYEGVTIVVGTQTGPFISGPVKTHRDQWTEMTGGEVEVVEIPYANLFEKIMTSFTTRTHAYDIIIYLAVWAGDIMGGGHVLPFTDYVKTDPTWDDIQPAWKDAILNWEGVTYAYPLDGARTMLYYRKDLIENPEYKKQFRSKYGYALAPPKTWEEYRDIAEFANGWDWDGDGEIEYGVLEVMARNSQTTWWLFNRSAAYSCLPGQKGALFFDLEDMTPLINGPGHVKGLENFVEIRNFAPPGSLNYSVGEVRNGLAAGEAALCIDWEDPGQFVNDPEQSKVVGKVGYAMLPGAKRVWNYKTKRWEDHPEINGATYMAAGGWIASITKTCKNPDAAFDLIKFLASPEISLIDVQTSGTGYNPYRYSHFENIQSWIDFGYSEPEKYLDVIQKSAEHPNVQPDLRIPGSARYWDVLELWITRALAGEVSPKQALDNAAKEWDQITDDLGRDQQLQYYRASLGM